MADLESIAEDFNGCHDSDIFGNDGSKIKNIAVNLNGNITDILLCDYSEKQFLIITQFKKIGTLVSVTKCCIKNLNGASDVYDIKTFCGLDHQEYHLVIRYLAQQLNIEKPVIFGICLKDKSLETLKAIVHVLKTNLFF